MINELKKLAYSLYRSGYKKEAHNVKNIIKKIAHENPPEKVEPLDIESMSEDEYVN